MNKIKAYFIFPLVHDNTEDDCMGSDIDIYIGGGGLYQSKKVKPSQYKGKFTGMGKFNIIHYIIKENKLG